MPKRLFLIVVLFLASCAPKNPATLSQPVEPTSIVETSLDSQAATAASGGEVEVGVVVVNVLNVRQRPGTSSLAVGSFSKGEKFYILGETINSTNNKWLLVSLSDNSFGWVIGDQAHVTIQKETVDLNTYSTWQKNVAAAKSLIPVTSP